MRAARRSPASTATACSSTSMPVDRRRSRPSCASARSACCCPHDIEPWIETYRGAVSPWETDVTEHFTVAFYFDRIAMAEATLAERLGLLDMLRAGGFTRRYDVRYAR